MTRLLGATARISTCDRAATSLVVALCLASSVSGAPVFKCVDPAGKISYQGTPCDKATTESTIKIEPPPPVSERRPQAPAPSARPVLREPTRQELAQAKVDARGPRETWQRLGQALNRGDIEAAPRELTPAAQQRFRPVFDTVTKKSNPPFKFDQLGKVQAVTLMGDTLATITLTRKKADGTYAYEVMLMKAPDGKWVIDGM